MKMEILIELLKEYGIYLLTSTGIFLSIILNRPKTAEKLEKKKEKHKQKLIEKGTKLAIKAMAILDKVEKENEVDVNE